MQLQDDFATYYVQQSLGVEGDMPGIALKTFFNHHDAVDWLKTCSHHNPGGSMREIRSFLHDSVPRPYPLTQMDDKTVMAEAARVLFEEELPIIIEPLFEPPDRQSDLIDLVYDVQNSGNAPAVPTPHTAPHFQLNRIGKYQHDNNIGLNVLKVIHNGLSEALNSGVDAVNAVIYDAQFIADNGFGDYVGRLKKAGANDIKNITKGTNDLIQHGPQRAMNAITSADLHTLKEFFGSVRYAENWEAAILVALGIAITKKPNNIIPKGPGATTTKTKVAKKKKPNTSAPEKNAKTKDLDGSKTTKAGLHNQKWDEIKVENFKTHRSVDLNNLSPDEKVAAKALEEQGWKNHKIEEVLGSGDSFTTKELNRGDKLYGFNSVGRGKDVNTSAYWLDETGYQDVKSKYCKDRVWDKEGVKGYLALPCYNRADAIDVAELTQATTAVESKIGRATELIQYGNKNGSSTELMGKIMGGGGNQVTVNPSVVKALPGM